MLIGRTLGDFLVKEPFAKSGGGGQVYLAEQISLGRDAVIKVVSEAGPVAQTTATRFLREARLASRLDHPFAAHVYGFGSEADGTLWLAMELVRGVSLEQWLKDQGALPTSRFIPFFDRLCEVLHAAHEQGIIHRDVKPQNVMVLNRAGRLLPKLLDLGIARSGNEPTPEESSTSTLAVSATRLGEAQALELTERGAFVGTPRYMAPEQWSHSTEADQRADIYSLAILAYEAIAGRHPFADANTLIALAAAHAVEELPPLPAELPAALYAVLSKAAAKKPDQRYASALEFAAAFRGAAGVEVEPLSLPFLDRDLLDHLLHDAPQPIAEAVALVETAYTPEQQLEAIVVTHRVCVRYLALLALLSRAKIGPGGNQDQAPVVELLRQLATKGLDDEEWLALGRELLRPFARRPAAHPLPELVAFFFPRGDEQSDDALADFVWPASGAGDELILGALQELVPRLGRALQKASFVCDYVVAVGESEAARWMGTRRLRRAVIKVSREQESPSLVDHAGATVMTLTPLLQVFAPSGGMEPELFLFDGPGRHGARLVALPRPFERQDGDLWSWFAKEILPLDPGQHEAALAEKPPYKGLNTFTREDADCYFGREAEAQAFANRLQVNRFLAVVGPSGSGKSSFVLAGVLPLLDPLRQVVVMRPGVDPFASLGSKLGLKPELLTNHPTALAELAVAKLQPEQSLLMVVDQFEELVTLCSDSAQRTQFAHALTIAAEAQHGRISVVITMRDDFLIRVQQIGPLRTKLATSLELLSTPARDDLLRIVSEPARRAGYSFDDPDLPNTMVETVSEYPGALALLSFTAAELWELRDRQQKQLRVKAYEALGGVGGALAHHAELTLAQLAVDEQPLVREAFRHLVTAEATRSLLSRQEMLEVLGGGERGIRVVEKLIAARLLVASESESGDDRLELIHEALIVAWPRLILWRQEDAETARLRDVLRSSARQWHERGRPRGLLWRADSLAELKVWQGRYTGRLTDTESDFARASLSEETSGRRIRQALSVGAFVILAIGSLFIFRAYQQAAHRYAALRQEQARNELAAMHPVEAISHLAGAIEGGLDNPEIRAMGGILERLLAGSQGLLLSDAGRIEEMLESDHSRWLAILSDTPTVHLNDLANNTAASIATTAKCSNGSFVGEGALLVGCLDGHLRRINLTKGVVDGDWPVAPHAIIALATIDRTRALVAVEGVGFLELALNSGQLTTIFAKPDLVEAKIVASHDRSRFALFESAYTATRMKAVLLYRPQNGQLLTIPRAGVIAASFSPADDALAIAAEHEWVGLCDTRRGEWLWQKATANPAPGNYGFAIAFSPDGQWVASGSNNQLVVRARNGETRFSIPAPLSHVIAWSPDQRYLFASGADQVLYAIDVRRGDIVFRHFGHRSEIINVVFDEPRQRLISAAQSEVRLWDPRQQLSVMAQNVGNISGIAPIPASPNVLITSSQGVFEIATSDGSAIPLIEQALPDQAFALTNLGRDVALLVDRNLTVFDAHGKNSLPTVHLDHPVGDFDFSDAGYLAILLASGEVEMWLQGTRVANLAGPFTSAVFVDASHLATCNRQGLLQAWDTSGAQLFSKQAYSSACGVTFDRDQELATWRSSDLGAGVQLWRWDGARFSEDEWRRNGMTVPLGKGIWSEVGLDGFWTVTNQDNALLFKTSLTTLPNTMKDRGPGAAWFSCRPNQIDFATNFAPANPTTILGIWQR